VCVLQSIERLTDVPVSTILNGKDRRMILYRLGYPVGRSMPGLDVADTLATVQYLRLRADIEPERIAIAGIGQGGMTALFTAALDGRIHAVAVADYFGPHAGRLEEPIDRRLCGQANWGGDAELAALVAPRPLVIVVREEREVREELQRARRLATARKIPAPVLKTAPPQELLAKAMAEMATALGLPPALAPSDLHLGSIGDGEIQVARNRHFEERLSALRRLLAESQSRRSERWGLETIAPQGLFKLRSALLADLRQLQGEVPTPATAPRTRLHEALSTSAYRAYRVLLDVTDGVEVYGNLLVPERIEGRRPAIVCQHGLNGTPEDITGLGETQDTVYHEFGRKLAERGYVVFAPLILHYHPPQWTNDQVRLADTVGMMRVALAAAQTRRVVDFLQNLPFVDPGKIGYYGLSYGGYSALWIPPLEPRLKAVVVSGHFNDWRSKITSESIGTSYLFHPDEDFYNWDVLHRFTHVELVLAMSPRPVAIEWGRRDAVTPPEWLSYAWGQLAALRDRLDLRKTIVLAEFDGVHEIHGTQTFPFLDRCLRDRQPPSPVRKL
jgi:cephalosporin-C deacetylase-like acetyl esterase